MQPIPRAVVREKRGAHAAHGVDPLANELIGDRVVDIRADGDHVRLGALELLLLCLKVVDEVLCNLRRRLPRVVVGPVAAPAAEKRRQHRRASECCLRTERAARIAELESLMRRQ